MDLNEIMHRFDSSPAQIKINEIDKRLKFIKQQFELLNGEKNKLHKKRYNLIDAANKEGDTVANKLDKECPEWRMIIVNELNDIRNK